MTAGAHEEGKKISSWPMWLLGLVSSYTMGGLIHILLVVAIVLVLIRVIQGRNPV